MGDRLTFLGKFFTEPVSTGAIVPSSPQLAAMMVRDMGLADADAVVELGPGTGSFTGAILSKLPDSAFFLAVELNAQFASLLTQRFPDLNVVNDSAEHLDVLLEKYGQSSADSILCGLPWAGFPDSLQDKLMKGVLSSLRPGGRFATFAYIHAAWFPAARRYRRRLEASFSSVTTTPVVWRNLPPAFVYRCEK